MSNMSNWFGPEEFDRIRDSKERIHPIIGEIWSSSVSYFLHDIEKMNFMLKIDLWNETVEVQRNFYPIYRGFCKKLIFIEINKFLCKLYKAKKKKDYIIIASIDSLPLKDKSIDIVLDILTSSHVKNKLFIKVLKEYKRVLKKSGYLILIQGNKKFIRIKKLRKTEKFSLKFKKFPWLLYLPRGYEEVKKHLERIGFQIIKGKYLIDQLSFYFCFPNLISRFLKLSFLRRILLSSLFFMSNRWTCMFFGFLAKAK